MFSVMYGLSRKHPCPSCSLKTLKSPSAPAFGVRGVDPLPLPKHSPLMCVCGLAFRLYMTSWQGLGCNEF